MPALASMSQEEIDALAAEQAAQDAATAPPPPPTGGSQDKYGSGIAEQYGPMQDASQTAPADTLTGATSYGQGTGPSAAAPVAPPPADPNAAPIADPAAAPVAPPPTTQAGVPSTYNGYDPLSSAYVSPPLARSLGVGAEAIGRNPDGSMPARSLGVGAEAIGRNPDGSPRYQPSYLSGSDTPSTWQPAFNPNAPSSETINTMGLTPTYYPDLAQQDSSISFRPAPPAGAPPPALYDAASGKYVGPRRNTGGTGTLNVPAWTPGTPNWAGLGTPDTKVPPRPEDIRYSQQLAGLISPGKSGTQHLHDMLPQGVQDALDYLRPQGQEYPIPYAERSPFPVSSRTEQGLGDIARGIQEHMPQGDVPVGDAARLAALLMLGNYASGSLIQPTPIKEQGDFPDFLSPAAIGQLVGGPKTAAQYESLANQNPLTWQGVKGAINQNPLTPVQAAAGRRMIGGTSNQEEAQRFVSDLMQYNPMGTPPMGGPKGDSYRAGSWVGEHLISRPVEAAASGKGVSAPTEQDVNDAINQAGDHLRSEYGDAVYGVAPAVVNELLKGSPLAAGPASNSVSGSILPPTTRSSLPQHAPANLPVPAPPLINYRDTTARYSPESASTMPRGERTVPPSAMPKGPRLTPTVGNEPSARATAPVPTPPLGNLTPQQQTVANRVAEEAVNILVSKGQASAGWGRQAVDQLDQNSKDTKLANGTDYQGLLDRWGQFQQNGADNVVFDQTVPTTRENVSLPDLQGPKPWGQPVIPPVTIPGLGNAVDQFKRNGADNVVFNQTVPTNIPSIGLPDFGGAIDQFKKNSGDNKVFNQTVPTTLPGLGDVGNAIQGLGSAITTVPGTGAAPAKSPAKAPAETATGGLRSGDHTETGDTSGLTYIVDSKGDHVGMQDENGNNVYFPDGNTQEENDAIKQGIVDAINAKGTAAPTETGATAPVASPSSAASTSSAPATSPPPVSTGGERPLLDSNGNDTGLVVNKDGTVTKSGGGSSGGYTKKSYGSSGGYSRGGSSGGYSRSKKKKKGSSTSPFGAQFWEGFPFNRPNSPIRQQILDAIAASKESGQARKKT